MRRAQRSARRPNAPPTKGWRDHRYAEALRPGVAVHDVRDETLVILQAPALEHAQDERARRENAGQRGGSAYASNPVASALNFSCLALSRTTATSPPSKPPGASASISRVIFTFAPGVF